MEIDFPVIGIAAMWGGFLGAFFFGGLWWSLQGISLRRHPGRFLGYSFLVRATLALGGFWLSLRFGVDAFLAAMAGFTIIRFFLTRRLGEPKGVEKRGN